MLLQKLPYRLKITACFLALCGYTIVVTTSFQQIEYSIGLLALIPIAVAGATFGPIGGLSIGLLTIALNTVVGHLFGEAGRQAVFRLGEGAGHGILILFGLVIGYVSNLHVELHRQTSFRKQTEDKLRKRANENWRLLEAARKRAREAETLRDASAKLTAILDLDEVLDGILIQLEQVIPYDSACIFLREGDRLRAVNGRGYSDPNAVIGRSFPADGPLPRTIEQMGRPIVLADAQADPRYEGWAGTDYVRGWMGIPLMIHGCSIGQVTVDSLQVGAYDDADAAMAQAFADQVAIVLENARLYEETQNRLQEVTLLSRIITLTATAQDLPGALEQLCTELANYFDVPQAACALLNPERTAAEVVAEYRTPDRPSGVGNIIPVDDNPSMAYVLEHKAPLAITDVRTDPRIAPVREILRQRDTVSLLLVPIIVGNEVVGTLGIDALQRREFEENDIKVAQHVAHQAGQALERLRLFSATREHDELMARLADLNDSFNRPLTVDGVAAAIGHGALALSEVQRAAVYLFASDTTAPCLWSKGLSQEYLNQVLCRARELPGGQLWHSTNPVLISNVGDVPEDAFLHELATNEQFEAVALWPLVYEGRSIAVVACYYDNPHHWSDAEREVMELFTRQAAVALENARLYEIAQRQALTDGLTGLYNSRYLYNHLAKELERSRRHERPCSLIILDLDNFKQYNDRYGHLAGDDLLRELARLIQDTIRQMDTAARYGGEEFVIILPETAYFDAMKVAERVRARVEQHEFIVRDSQTVGCITISAGVATFPTYAGDREALIDAADTALLRAKDTKNVVCGIANSITTTRLPKSRPSPIETE